MPARTAAPPVPREPHPGLRRTEVATGAVETLKLAVQLRLARGLLDEARARSVAGGLDAAAIAVERSQGRA